MSDIGLDESAFPSEPLGVAIDRIIKEARDRVAALPPPTIEDHLDSLDALTECSCDLAYAERGLVHPACRHEYRLEVDAVRSALGVPR